MRLALVTCIWNRHDLEKIVIDRFKEQSKRFGFELIVAGSEGKSSQEIANGCHYIEIENYPLGRKHNALITKAKELDVDGVVLFGSDDIVSDSYFEFLLKFTPEESNLIGLSDLYFYSTKTKEIGLFKHWGMNKKTIGAGRFYSKAILEQMNWKLWEDEKNVGLDSSSSYLLSINGIQEQAFTMEETDCFLCDIKHTQSITYEDVMEATEKVNLSIMAKKVGKETATKVQELKREEKAIVFDMELVGEQEIVSTGLNKEMPKGQEYTVSAETAEVLIKKGFATLKK